MTDQQTLWTASEFLRRRFTDLVHKEVIEFIISEPGYRTYFQTIAHKARDLLTKGNSQEQLTLFVKQAAVIYAGKRLEKMEKQLGPGGDEDLPPVS